MLRSIPFCCIYRFSERPEVISIIPILMINTHSHFSLLHSCFSRHHNLPPPSLTHCIPPSLNLFLSHSPLPSLTLSFTHPLSVFTHSSSFPSLTHFSSPSFLLYLPHSLLPSLTLPLLRSFINHLLTISSFLIARNNSLTLPPSTHYFSPSTNPPLTHPIFPFINYFPFSFSLSFTPSLPYYFSPFANPSLTLFEFTK